MWLLVGDSVAGTSHAATSLPCQDSCLHGVLGNGASEVALFVVSDGAGSASHSHLGSQLVCKTFIDHCANQQPALGSNLDRAFASKLLTHLLEDLAVEAATQKVEPRELACTFLAAIVGLDWAYFIQLGDGAIVVDDEAGLSCAFWPMSGEYANITTFITSPNAAEQMLTAKVNRQISRVALFSDGLQLLALNFQAKTPFPPFFTPMFNFMANCADGSAVTVPLREFLGSSAVNAKTDDDKTLLLGLRKE